MSTDTVNAAAVRLPQFSPNQPLTWFRRADIERHFKLKGMTNSVTKADYALEAIPEAVFQTISPWLDTQLEDIKYETLKTTLLKEFLPPAPVRASRLLDLRRQPIGNRTQTQVWHEIATLRQLPEIDETTKQHKHLDLYKKISLQCLPSEVRSALHDTEGSIDELIEQANQLKIALNAANYQSSNQRYVEVAAATTTTKDNSDINLQNIINNICGYHCLVDTGSFCSV